MSKTSKLLDLLSLSSLHLRAPSCQLSTLSFILSTRLSTFLVSLPSSVLSPLLILLYLYSLPGAHSFIVNQAFHSPPLPIHKISQSSIQETRSPPIPSPPLSKPLADNLEHTRMCVPMNTLLGQHRMYQTFSPALGNLQYGHEDIL